MMDRQSGMPQSSHPTIRSLARSLGLSRTTVSYALNGRGRVGSRTAELVRRAAEAAGYKANPLTATVLGQIRRSSGASFHGTIAMLDLFEPVHWPHGPFPREMVAGAKQRALEMGFSVEEFVVGAGHLTVPRLDTILQSRGINAIVVLPTWQSQDLSALDWSRYAAINTDYLPSGPALHSVCCEHYESMLMLLEKLRELGYRRPGLLVEKGRAERVQYRQLAALSAFRSLHPECEAVPPLITEQPPRCAEDFAPWFKKHRPDVLLTHVVESKTWLESCERKPGETGFVLLNLILKTFPCSGLDLQPRVLGARAVELVIGQLLRNELGVPSWPSKTTVLARWVEGPTTREKR